MPPLGRYADLPVPAEWLPILERLKPAPALLEAPLLPSPVELANLAFKRLNQREREIVFARFGLEKTLDQAATPYGITRERVRQIENAAIRKVKVLAPAFLEAVATWLRESERLGTQVGRLPDVNLEGLLPVGQVEPTSLSPELATHEAPSPANLLDLALDVLDERQAWYIFERYCLEQATEEAGRQVGLRQRAAVAFEEGVVQAVRYRSPAFAATLGRWLEVERSSGFAVTTLPPDDPPSAFLNATPEQLWRGAIELYSAVSRTTYALEATGNNRYVVYEPKRARSRQWRRVERTKPLYQLQGEEEIDAEPATSEGWLGQVAAEPLWLCVIRLYREAAEEQVWVTQWPNGLWAIHRLEHALRRAADPLEGQTRFAPLETVAINLGVGVEDLARGWALFANLFVTEGGLAGSSRWSVHEWIEAVAWELAESAHVEWHFSQMAKALALVNPEKFGDVTGRRLTSMLSRTGASAFQLAGTKGFWRLEALGDGYYDNRAAIIAVLEASDLPLHQAAVLKRLARATREGTVAALLGRDPAFKSFGDGVYGLADRSYPLRTAEEAWLESVMGDRTTVEVESVHRQAELDGVDPERLRGAIALSEHFCYSRFRDRAWYQTRAENCARRFDRWFESRLVVAPPSEDVLLEGFARAHAAGDHRRILEAEWALRTHHHPIGDTLDDYVMIAQANVGGGR